VRVDRRPYAHAMRRGAGRVDVRLGRIGVGWRAAVTIAAIGALVCGSGWGTDDAFPAGPMVQYAFHIDPNGTISSNYIEAETTAGTRVRVRLSSDGVGIPRGEIEGQLGRIIADPSLLQSIADAQRRRHPDEPQFVRLYLVVDVTHLHNRVPGAVTKETLATWAVER
jgi:hypothetical protein